MVAPAYYTWDMDTTNSRPSAEQAARPASIADLGDAAHQDDAADPPIPPEMPYSAELNEWANQLAGVNRVILASDITVQFSGGTPGITNVAAMSTLVTTSWVQENMTVVHVGTGIVSITWPLGALPAPRAPSRAWILASSPAPYPQPQVVAIPNGIEVYTWNLSGTATDLNFVVSIY